MKSSSYFDERFLKSLGVCEWGYTEESAPRSWQNFEKWIGASSQGPLSYLADERKDLRKDLKNVYPDFQSALVFLFDYRETKKWMLDQGQHSVAAYSLGYEGHDYHFFLKQKLVLISERLKETVPDLQFFVSLDAQPLLERDLAYRAGLGWFGKNSMLINRKEGSYFIIGSLLLSKRLDLSPAVLETDHCGQCMACVEACPTGAIDPHSRTLKAQKCLSTFTIETFKEVDPPAGHEKSRGEIFGCDICQDVCPWSKKSLLGVEARLKLEAGLSFLKAWFFETPKRGLYELMSKETNRGLKRRLKGTPFDRPGREGWLKNLRAFFSRSNQSGL